MQKLTLICYASLLIICTGCNEDSNNVNSAITDTTVKKQDSLPITGNDRDVHGCIGSAGYTWSVINNSCIKLFESAIRLMKNYDSTVPSAFVLFSADEKQAELFLPDNDASLILQLQGEEGNEAWINGSYKMYAWKGGYILENNGEQIYAGSPHDR